MARANRRYLPGYICHITHRCHKDSRWFDGIAVGYKIFIKDTKTKLGKVLSNNKILEKSGAFLLKEPYVHYCPPENSFLW